TGARQEPCAGLDQCSSSSSDQAPMTGGGVAWLAPKASSGSASMRKDACVCSASSSACAPCAPAPLPPIWPIGGGGVSPPIVPPAETMPCCGADVEAALCAVWLWAEASVSSDCCFEPDLLPPLSARAPSAPRPPPSAPRPSPSPVRR